MRLREIGSLSKKEELEILKYQVINYRTGIIKEMLDIPKKNIEPELFNTMTVPSQMFMTEIFGWDEEYRGMGGSFDISLNNAHICSIGENIERYCSGFYDKTNFIKSSFDQINKDAITPNDFALIHLNQRATLNHFTKDIIIDWTAAYSLKNRKIKYVPAAMVYVPYLYENANEMIFQPVSTGLSAHTNIFAASLKSINEVIERDAFTIFWYNEMSREEIAFPTGIGEIDDYVKKYFSDFFGSFKVLNITTDLGIPTFFAYVRGDYEKGEPEIAVGAASDIDPAKAYIKALTEAFHTRSWGIEIIMNTPLINRKPLAEEKWNEITNFEQHVKLYCYPDYINRIDFFMNPDRIVSFKERFSLDFYNKSIKDKFSKTVTLLIENGFDPLIVDITTKEIRGLGLLVTRAIIPGLHPINAEYKNRYLGGKRLYTVPTLLGYERKNLNEMNPMPHPFP